MKLLLYFGHPAQFLMFRQTIVLLKEKGWEIKIVIKTKDVLETLLKESGLEFENILQKGRGNNKWSILLGMLKRDVKMLGIARKFNPDLMIGTNPSIAHVSCLLRLPGITIIEDDYSVVKSLALMTYPFTKHILCPDVCKVGKYEKKKIGYAGYMKLGYLHPKVFAKDEKIIGKYQLTSKFILIRLSALKAYHDSGIGGIDMTLLDKLLEICFSFGYEVKISTETELASQYEKYRLDIEIQDIHHILSIASLFISDSQSMSVEAAMLGVPSVRYSGFAGRISVLEELEYKYGLTFGIQIGEKDKLFSKIKEIIQTGSCLNEFQTRKVKMLSEKIDLTAFLIWFFENYPESVNILKRDKYYQLRFQ